MKTAQQCASMSAWNRCTVSGQVEAEEAARAAAKEGLGRKLREAEARAESLAETVEELRAGLERQRAAADMRCDSVTLQFFTRRS